MADPKVCVSLEGTTVKEMADEAARANLAGADFVEVRFDRLYLKKPEAQPVEDENGEVKHVMPPETEWIERSMATIGRGRFHSKPQGEHSPAPSSSPFARAMREGTTPEARGSDTKSSKAIASGVNTVDLELSIDESVRFRPPRASQRRKVHVISSIHDTNHAKCGRTRQHGERARQRRARCSSSAARSTTTKMPCKSLKRATN